MKKQFGLVEPEGKICWQVLQKGMSERCPFCPVPRLLRDGPSAAPLRWEEHNTSNGCIYENFDSLIHGTMAGSSTFSIRWMYEIP